MLWGIDELLTYHYLVAEFFQTADAAVTPELFFALPKVLVHLYVYFLLLFLKRACVRRDKQTLFGKHYL